jgi:hypothetical protein
MYTPKAIDPVLLEKGLNQGLKYQEQQEAIKSQWNSAFLAGYRKAVEDAISGLHCSNYALEDKKETPG